MSAQSYIKGILSGYKHYKDYWNYEDGCILMGCKQLYEATGERAYLDFILDYTDPLIAADGTITNFEFGKHSIDSFNAGKILFLAYDKTGDERYRKAIDFLMRELRDQPRTAEGNFIHKAIYPGQVWLDGLYMAQPFYMEYETRYGGKEHYNDILSQFRNVRKYMYDSVKGLYYHGYDTLKEQPWCDKQTGLSPNFWLRSVGWYLMALIDVIDNMSEEIYEQYREYCDLFREAVTGILRYRAEDGLFCQVIDHMDTVGNYTETSGSAMIAYAIMKAARLKVLSREKYEPIGIDIFDSIVKNKLKDVPDGSQTLTDICWVAGLGPGDKRDGSVAYYLSEKIVSDDAKGVGPFMMAYAQKLLLEKTR